MFRSILAALLLSLVPHAAGPTASSAAQTPNLVLLLASDQSAYLVGSTATFTLAVDNRGDTPLTATFSSSQLYDLVVSDGTREVWRWSADKMFATVIRDRTFPPGVTLLGRETWDWRDASGAALPPGSYRVVGSLATSPPREGNVLLVDLNAR
jgi:hypothetical protein